MYKFTNGLVVFDEKTRDEYIKAGYRLVEHQVTIDEAIKETDNENKDDDRIVEGKSKQRNKVSK